MPENLDQLVRAAISAAQEQGDLPAFEVGDVGLERPNDTSHGVHEYSKLYKVVETEEDFYMEIERGHSVIIQKKNCSDELIAFLRTMK